MLYGSSSRRLDASVSWAQPFADPQRSCLEGMPASNTQPTSFALTIFDSLQLRWGSGCLSCD